MWLAYHKGIPPEEFQKWLKDNGIEKACAEYRRIMRELDKAERDKQIDKVLVDPKKEPDKAPLLPATPITGGCVGLKLAVVDFTLDGWANSACSAFFRTTATRLCVSSLPPRRRKPRKSTNRKPDRDPS